MTLFKTNPTVAHKETLSFLRAIAQLIQPLSDRPLLVQYEEAPVMGEGTPFYHISYSVSILDRRHPLYIFGMIPGFAKPASSAMILVYDLGMKQYQMNSSLTDETKAKIRKAIHARCPDVVIGESTFIN